MDIDYLRAYTHRMSRKIIFCLCFLFSFNAYAVEPIGYMEPLPKEMLSNPVKLFGQCSDVKILEWRAKFILNKKSNKNISTISNLCIKSYFNFWRFSKLRGLKFEDVQSKLNTKLSIIPLDSDNRNLNDVYDRFFYRSKSIKNNKVIPIWGYFQEQANFIYIRSDIFNRDGSINSFFSKTFVHELFHALSWHYHVYHNLSGNKDRR